jgi:hypothetical protein
MVVENCLKNCVSYQQCCQVLQIIKDRIPKVLNTKSNVQVPSPEKHRSHDRNTKEQVGLDVMHYTSIQKVLSLNLSQDTPILAKVSCGFSQSLHAML